MKIFAAPLQGLTEAPFRHFHAEIYGHEGAADAYFAPFARIEHESIRAKDLKDITSPFNVNHTVVPQVIARDGTEFSRLVETIAATGYRHINLNMGCPFPPQNHKGRGAALLMRPDSLISIQHTMEKLTTEGMSFSIKMRLGLKSPDEWIEIADIINEMPLTYVAIHPRTAIQQYEGELYLDLLSEYCAAIKHPWIYNGDIRTPDDLNRLIAMFPSAYGFMIGRGLLARPSLIAEWRNGQQWSPQQRIGTMLQLHTTILQHFKTILCGEKQVLSKIKPFWTYASTDEIGRKQLKAIAKASNLTKYESAVATIGQIL